MGYVYLFLFYQSTFRLKYYICYLWLIGVKSSLSSLEFGVSIDLDYYFCALCWENDLK